MKWILNNFSLNMVNVPENYTLTVEQLSELQFKVESKSAINRLSKLDICQELDLLPHKGTVTATMNDILYVAQYLNGELTFRKITICEVDTK